MKINKVKPCRAGNSCSRESRTCRPGTGTVGACLVSIAPARLRRAGLLPLGLRDPLPEPERQLYHLLREEGGDAYSRYNSLPRELVSFEQSLDRLANSQAPTSMKATYSVLREDDTVELQYADVVEAEESE